MCFKYTSIPHFLIKSHGWTDKSLYVGRHFIVCIYWNILIFFLLWKSVFGFLIALKLTGIFMHIQFKAKCIVNCCRLSSHLCENSNNYLKKSYLYDLQLGFIPTNLHLSAGAQIQWKTSVKINCRKITNILSDPCFTCHDLNKKHIYT